MLRRALHTLVFDKTNAIIFPLFIIIFISGDFFNVVIIVYSSLIQDERYVFLPLGLIPYDIVQAFR